MTSDQRWIAQASAVLYQCAAVLEDAATIFDEIGLHNLAGV